MRDPHARKVRFIKATLAQAGDHCHADVELAGDGGARFMGGADGPASKEEQLRTGALAAAAAAERASSHAGARVEIDDLALLEEFGTEIVLVSLRATARGETWQLYGVCNVHGDLAAAAALAVLNATNRVLDLA